MEKDEVVEVEVGTEIRIEHDSDSPYSPLYNPKLAHSDERKKRKLVLVGLIGVLIFAVVGLICTMSIVVNRAMQELDSSQTMISEFLDDVKETVIDGLLGEFSVEFEAEYDTEDEYNHEDDEVDSDYTEDESVYHTEEYQPTEDDVYYVQFADSIRDDLSYQVVKDSVIIQEEGIVFEVEYPIIQNSELENLDEINKQLGRFTLEYAQLAAGEIEQKSFCVVLVDAYIANMTEEMLSIIYEEKFQINNEVYYRIRSVNLNMEQGYFYQNLDLIEPSMDLVDAFVKQSEFQNGTYMLDQFTKEELLAYLSDESSLAVFYTPVGLEVGITHATGWTTVTLKDYEQFIPKL